MSMLRVSVYILIGMKVMACSPLYSGRKAPKAQKGILDLRQWQFEKDGPIRIDGEWEVLWNRLLKGSDELSHLGQNSEYYSIPQKSWVGHHTTDGHVLTNKGYATFRVKVLLPTDENDSAVNLLAIGRTFSNSSQNLKVIGGDGRVLGPPVIKGIVGDTPNTSIPVWTEKNQTVYGETGDYHRLANQQFSFV